MPAARARRRTKLVVAVIDGVQPAMLERAVAEGVAPVLGELIERGLYIDDCVSAFPSVTPVCAATIATGVGPDRHHIPAMNWYDRLEGRYVEYGSSLAAARRFGITRQLIDVVYNLNRVHLAGDVATVFERLDDADLRTAGTTYLMYRGRHEHQPTADTPLTRLAATLFRHPVQGPREFFYADIFASRRTGCRSQMGMPGQRDQHTGCVGAYLVEHDLFDFLLFSLPDNDAHSHRRGLDAQVQSLGVADQQLARLMEAGGGPERFLDEHAIIVLADHAHSEIREALSLPDLFADFIVLQPRERSTLDAEIAICPSQRSAQIYVLVRRGRRALMPRLLDVVLSEPAIDLVLWREGARAVIGRGKRRLRFAPGAGLTDERGRTWEVEGDVDLLAARLEDNRLVSPGYPDALGRSWSAITCPTAGDLLLSAADGFEFVDWGGVSHVGGSSHGSLDAGDSLGPLIFCGTGPTARGERRWSIADVAPAVAGHFALDGGGR
ncbi:MAG: alkaline phosphatase family protein [Actinobacteria bacterium]|nr:MAG: alkaline phosphatase family protein [Actinomycetota bacterium]